MCWVDRITRWQESLDDKLHIFTNQSNLSPFTKQPNLTITTTETPKAVSKKSKKSKLGSSIKPSYSQQEPALRVSRLTNISSAANLPPQIKVIPGAGVSPQHYLPDTPTANPIESLDNKRIELCRQIINEVDDKRENEKRRQEREARERENDRARFAGVAITAKPELQNKNGKPSSTIGKKSKPQKDRSTLGEVNVGSSGSSDSYLYQEDSDSDGKNKNKKWFQGTQQQQFHFSNPLWFFTNKKCFKNGFQLFALFILFAIKNNCSNYVSNNKGSNEINIGTQIIQVFISCIEEDFAQSTSAFCSFTHLYFLFQPLWYRIFVIQYEFIFRR